MQLIRLLTLAVALLALSACTALPPDATALVYPPASEAAAAALAQVRAQTTRTSRLYELARLPEVSPPQRLPDLQTAPVDRFSLESPPDPAEGGGGFHEFERGGASWYGPGLQGRRTASGERYDMNALTAAHRTLPFGTVVRVRSLVNGKEVEVRITDRGPFVESRVIDISRAAAVELGMLGLGFKEVALLVSDAIPEVPQARVRTVKPGRKLRRPARLAQRR